MQYIQDKIDEFNKNLDNYDVKIGLPKISETNNLAEKYLNLDFATAKLTPDESAEAGAVLSQFSYYLQKTVNREEAKLVWLNGKIKKIIVGILPQIKSYNWSEREMSAIAQDDVAIQYDEERTRTEIRIKHLSYLSGKVEKLSEKYVELSRTLRNKVKE